MLALAALGDPTQAAPAAATADGTLLRVVLGLAVALVLAVVATHPFVRKLEKRFGLTVLVSSGLPFLLLGVVFRNDRVGILTEPIVNDLRPALEFGLGWHGIAVGMQFDVREIDTLPEKSGTVVVAESAIPFFTTAVALIGALAAIHVYGAADQTTPFWSQVGATLRSDSLRDALALGACAAPAAPIAAVAIARTSGSVAANLVARVTAMNDVAGVVVLALVCAFFLPTDAVAAWKLPHIAWLFVTLGMGGVLGILTYVLVRSAKSVPEEVAYLLGAIALSSGMSGYLGISPLVSCAIAGALLTNLPHAQHAQLKETILEVERPLYLIFLLVAGALWDPTQLTGWLIAPLFVAARVGGKIVGAYVAKRTGPPELPDATTLGLALSPQSPISIATIVSYMTLYKGAAGNLVTACIGGAVVTELGVQAVARLRGGLRFDSPSLTSIRPPVVVPAPGDVPTIPKPPSMPHTPTIQGVGLEETEVQGFQVGDPTRKNDPGGGPKP
jgi:hypothetical protein